MAKPGFELDKRQADMLEKKGLPPRPIPLPDKAPIGDPK